MEFQKVLVNEISGVKVFRVENPEDEFEFCFNGSRGWEYHASQQEAEDAVGDWLSEEAWLMQHRPVDTPCLPRPWWETER